MANKPIAAVPTKVPINHNGIRPVVPVLDIRKKKYMYFDKTRKNKAKKNVLQSSFCFERLITVPLSNLFYL